MVWQESVATLFLRGNYMNCCHSNSLPFHQGERWDSNPRIQLTILNQCFLLRILLCVLELSTFLYHLLKPLAYSRQRSSRSAVLLPLSPLRTVHESFPSHGSSTYKPCVSRTSSSTFFE